MKTAVVPAQVTTVEDKVAGNLGFSQLLLLALPVFFSGVLLVLMPPMMSLTLLKMATGSTIAITCMTLAIRVKGKLVAEWLAVMVRYAVRPRYYLYNKNDRYLRPPLLAHMSTEKPRVVLPCVEQQEAQMLIPTYERARLELSMADPRAKFHLKANKGGLRVYITEIKEESI